MYGGMSCTTFEQPPVIGRMSITGGCSKVVQDIPPYMTADGNPLLVRGINKIGLERHGASKETVRALREAYRLLYRKKLGARDMVARSRETLPRLPEVEHLEAFVADSERGITR